MGTATASDLGTDSVAVAMSGDCAANQGALYGSMNLARIFNLPVVLVTEDNGYAETTANSWPIAGPGMVSRAQSFGIPAVGVDGADVFAVEAAARHAIGRARSGEGPSHIVIDVPMFCGHDEGDTETCRPRGEVAQQRRNHDCLKICRARVAAAGWLDAQAIDQVEAEVEVEEWVEAAFERTRNAPEPDLATPTTNVFVSQ